MRNRVTGEPLEDVTTLGSHTLIRALPPTERAAFAECWDNPPIMLREDRRKPMVGAEGLPHVEGGTIVNDDAGIPRLFSDVRDAIRWCREFGEPSDRRAPSSSDRTSSDSSPGIIRSEVEPAPIP
jgi:hypothetical protein